MNSAQRDLLEFIAGRADQATRRRLRESAREPDTPGGLLELELTGKRTTPSLPSQYFDDVSIAGSKTPQKWRAWRTFAACLILACALGLSPLAYRWLQPPYLQDEFDDEWVDYSIWDTPRAGVRELSGYVRLTNRGYIVSKKLLPDGAYEIVVRWRWSDLAEFPQYADHLCIGIRTSGTPRDEHAFELEDGLKVTVDCKSGRVNLTRMSEPRGEVLATTQLREPMPPGQLSAPLDKPLPMPADRWHSVTIVDDQKVISVYMSGPQVPERFENEPVISAAVHSDGKPHRLAIYNREYLAGVPHQMEVDTVTVTELSE